MPHQSPSTDTLLDASHKLNYGLTTIGRSGSGYYCSDRKHTWFVGPNVTCIVDEDSKCTYRISAASGVADLEADAHTDDITLTPVRTGDVADDCRDRLDRIYRHAIWTTWDVSKDKFFDEYFRTGAKDKCVTEAVDTMEGHLCKRHGVTTDQASFMIFGASRPVSKAVRSVEVGSADDDAPVASVKLEKGCSALGSAAADTLTGSTTVTSPMSSPHRGKKPHDWSSTRSLRVKSAEADSDDEYEFVLPHEAESGEDGEDPDDVSGRAVSPDGSAAEDFEFV